MFLRAGASLGLLCVSLVVAQPARAASPAAATAAAASATTATVTTSQAPPGALSCASPTIYNLTPNGGLLALDENTGANTPVASFGAPPSGDNWNGLGVSPFGTDAWAVLSTGSTGGTTTIGRYNATAGTTATYTGTAPTSGANFVMGAIDPASIYYYGPTTARPSSSTASTLRLSRRSPAQSPPSRRLRRR